MVYKGTLHVAPVSFTDTGEAIIDELVKVPTPQTYNWSKEDLDAEEGTGRNNATGEMFRDRVATKRKLSFTFPPLGISDTSRLLKAVSSEEFIAVRYLDAYEGDYLTKIFYAGSQSADCGHRQHWLGIQFNLVEK